MGDCYKENETGDIAKYAFRAIFECYDDAFIYAMDSWLNVHEVKMENGEVYYEVY